MLQIRVRVFQNPWSHTVPDAKLIEFVTHTAEKRAEHVAKQFEAGAYKRESLGLAILDPSAPLWRPSSETLLATMAIGLEGEQFVPNAIAKAVEHRDKGQLAGYGAYVDLTQTQDGDFTYGFSSQVDGTIAGASGQTELQDACEAGHAAVTFNYWIRVTRKEWLDQQETRPRWFTNTDLPRELYLQMAREPTVVYDSKFDEKMNSDPLVRRMTLPSGFDPEERTIVPEYHGD